LEEHNHTASKITLKIARVWRGLGRVTSFLGAVGTGCILVLMILTTADVVLRYILGIPLKGAYEISEIMMLSSVFLGMAYTQLFHEHINADFLVSRLSKHTNLVLETVLLLPALLIFGLLAWQGAIFFVDSLRTGEYRWGLLRIPLWPARLMVPLGASFLCLRFIGEIVINFRKLLNWNKEAS
jgi:TRAP-type C4-dicarboxylate transport system permease small subunit